MTNISPQYLIAIDQGTTSSRAIIYNQELQVVSQGSQEFKQYFPEADWVEHDLNEIWSSVCAAIESAVKNVEDPNFSLSKVAGIGITNQRETFGLWEKKSGTPAGRAIVWQCRRSAKICAKLKNSATGRKLMRITGLVIDPYFSGTKVKWLFDRDKKLKARARSGELLFGTIDTYLIYRLSGGECHVTDESNASRTLFMDLKKRQWSPDALKILGVPKAMLPKILTSAEYFGSTRGLSILPDGIPIHGVLGDQQAALFGQECFSKGEAKVTYGTGAFYLLNTGSELKRTRCGVSTMAWTLNGKPSYALEGSVFIAGAAVQWLRDGLSLFEKSSEIESLALEVKDSDGVFFIPALSGLGAPYWASHAKGLIGGLTRRSTKAHLARACLEGIAHTISDGFTGLVKDAGVRVKVLRVDGGASANQLLLQTQADLLQTKLQRPRDIESTARGAASIAALGLGWIKSPKELRAKNPLDVEVGPRMTKTESRKKSQVWERRVQALIKGAY